MKKIAFIVCALVALISSGANTFGFADYKFFIPVHSNLVKGVVMGDAGDYGNVRYEDVAWLRNAFEERRQAMSEMKAPYTRATNELHETINSHVNSLTNFIVSNEVASIISGGVYKSRLQPMITRPEYTFFGDDAEVNAESVVFAHPSNQFSTATRLINTNYVPSAGYMAYSNRVGQVTNILEREIIRANGTAFVNTYTNVYYVGSNIWYYSHIVTNRSPQMADFCFKDYQREGVRWDNGSHTSRIPFEVINKFSITNMYGFLKDATNIGRIESLVVDSSEWERTDSEYEHDVHSFSGDDNTPPWTNTHETNKVTIVSNSLPRVSVESSLSESGGYQTLYSLNLNDNWVKYSEGGSDITEFSSKKTDAGRCVIRLRTHITTNAYEEIDRLLPIEKVVCFAMARIEYVRSSSSSVTANNEYLDDSTSTNVSEYLEVMIPIGDASSIHVPNNPNKITSTEFVCLEIEVNDFQNKMTDAMASFLNGLPAVYKGVPQYMYAMPSPQDVPTGNDPGNPSRKRAYNYDSMITMYCQVTDIYGAFFYNFETTLNHWKKPEEGGK